MYYTCIHVCSFANVHVCVYVCIRVWHVRKGPNYGPLIEFEEPTETRADTYMDICMWSWVSIYCS